MALHRPRYRVHLNNPEDVTTPLEHELEVTYGDQLRGELEASKLGLPSIKDAPQNNVAVWVWCALVRLGLYKGQSQQFRTADLLDLEPLDKPGEVPTVDPTPPAASDAPA